MPIAFMRIGGAARVSVRSDEPWQRHSRANRRTERRRNLVPVYVDQERACGGRGRVGVGDTGRYAIPYAEREGYADLERDIGASAEGGRTVRRDDETLDRCIRPARRSGCLIIEF